jgi:hypothetical protein
MKSKATMYLYGCTRNDLHSQLFAYHWAEGAMPQEHSQVCGLIGDWDDGNVNPAELQEAIDECLEALRVILPVKEAVKV